MRHNTSDTPRHQRPRWEVAAFVAAILGLIALARTGKTDAKVAHQEKAPSATAGISVQE